MNLMKLISTASALVLSANAAAVPASQSAEKTSSSEAVRYEFEDGKTEGGKIYLNGDADVDMGDWPEGTNLSGFSGKGFSYLDQKGTTVSVEVDVPKAGLGLSIARTLVRRMGGTITAEYADSRLKIKIKF